MKPVIEMIKKILLDDRRIIFAYLFGSFLKKEDFNDIDIGIYCMEDALENPFEVTSDLKISLSKATDLLPDSFDITIINYLFSSDRMHSLLILGDVFDGLLLVDRNPFLRTDLIERVSAQFTESEGILQEIFI